MYQFYNYDFSEFTQEDINRQGLYDVDLDYFLARPTMESFLYKSRWENYRFF